MLSLICFCCIYLHILHPYDLFHIPFAITHLWIHGMCAYVYMECNVYEFYVYNYVIYAYNVCNVKVKVSLCLTKHHAVKAYWGSGGIAPRILDLGTRWR